MTRNIKPQRTQRDTESCYFSLSSPLRALCTLWFSETLHRKYQKVSEVLVTATQDTREPKRSGEISTCGSVVSGGSTLLVDAQCRFRTTTARVSKLPCNKTAGSTLAVWINDLQIVRSSSQTLEPATASDTMRILKQSAKKR